MDAASGVLSGAPTARGAFNFTVRATSNNCFGEQAYSLLVGQGAPVITVTAPAPNIVGNLVIYSATVKPSATGSPNPTGAVQFKLNGTAIGNTAPLVNGRATLTLAAPASGSYRVSVSYSGDSNYLAGSGTTNTQLVIFNIRSKMTRQEIIFCSMRRPRQTFRAADFI